MCFEGEQRCDPGPCTAILGPPAPYPHLPCLLHHHRPHLLTPPARLEAMIDFGEDEGIADDVAAGVVPLVAALRRQLERHLASAVSGELVRCGAAVFWLR